eukprot:Tbor_TRINITY_DN5255_c5_g1::TRINITY_DN5255_c5_g1_i1::g.16617::m.16617
MSSFESDPNMSDDANEEAYNKHQQMRDTSQEIKTNLAHGDSIVVTDTKGIEEENTNTNANTQGRKKSNESTVDDFIFVGRPLYSARLASEYMKREKFPNAREVMETSEIRRKLHTENMISGIKSESEDTMGAAAIFGDECEIFIDQGSFYRDVLRSFSSREERQELESECVAFQKDRNRKEYLKHCLPQNPQTLMMVEYDNEYSNYSKKRTAPGNIPERPLTDQQWAKVWQQFQMDIGRESLYIDNERYGDPSKAFVALIDLFMSYGESYDLYAEEMSKRQQENSSLIGSFILRPLSTILKCALNIGCLLKDTPECGVSQEAMKRSEKDESIVNAEIEGLSENKAEELIARRTELAQYSVSLARLVVLLSQQSVLALPYEILLAQYATSCPAVTNPLLRHNEGDNTTNNMNNIYIGEIVKEDYIIKEEGNYSSPAGGMSVWVEKSLGDGTNMPRVSINIEKEFRVFSLINTDDETQFHIVVHIGVSLTDGEDPLHLRWTLKEGINRLRRAPNERNSSETSEKYEEHKPEEGSPAEDLSVEQEIQDEQYQYINTPPSIIGDASPETTDPPPTPIGSSEDENLLSIV